MNSVSSNDLNLKYQRLDTSSGCKAMEIRKFDLWQRVKLYYYVSR